MPKLIIDNREIEVPEGTKVIDAAERVGIYIPRFCYFAELGAVGACRVCAVKFEDGPVSGIQMSCMIDAADKMVVSTTDPEAMDFRKHVIEWLMMNHPHDCPVCDEGGHCLLQDLTEACGHGIRRYPGPKRTYVDQYLGPLIQHEENRCIQCYRCSRFYQEFCGYTDLGVMGIAQRIYFGRYSDGVLENPFSGNIIDLCPTGVYTDKPSRYTGRRWDYERTAGVCIHCSIGCNIKTSARYREIVYLEAHYNELVNGAFICDRGRYGFFYANSEARPWKGRVDGEQVPPENAIMTAVERLKAISGQHGDGTVAVVGSERSSLETQAACVHLCRVQCWLGPVFRDGTAPGIQNAISRLTPENAVSMRAIESADFILVVGADPINEAPMLTLAMRQAWRKGARIAAIDPRPLKWPFVFEQISVKPDEIYGLLSEKQPGSVSENSTEAEAIGAIKKHMQESRRPVVICGTGITDPETVSASADFTEALREKGADAGLFYTLPRSNTYGSILLDENGASLEDLLQRIDSGEVKALVVVESDLWETYPDRNRLAKSLDRLELLVVTDCMSTEFVRRADIVIPALSIFETGGIYVNQEGRAQWSTPAHTGGTPIEITGDGGHPPRIIRPDIPGGDVTPSWKTAWWLADLQPPAAHELMIDWMVRTYPDLEPIADMPRTGVRLYLPEHRRRVSNGNSGEKEKGNFIFLPASATFGDEPLSSASPCLETYAKPLELWMADLDARKLSASDGDAIRLDLAHEPLELTVRTSAHVAPGVIVVYRQPGLYWQQFDPNLPYCVNTDQISINSNPRGGGGNSFSQDR